MRGVAPEAMKRLQSYGWPGNIRELRNAVERAMLLSDTDVLQTGDFTIGGSAAVKLGDRVELPPNGIDLPSSSNARWSCRRSSARSGTRPGPQLWVSIGTRSAIASRNSTEKAGTLGCTLLLRPVGGYPHPPGNNPQRMPAQIG